MPDPACLYPDTLRGRECGLGLAAAGRVVAVGQEDDPLLRVVREEGGREAQGRTDVGGGLDGCGGDAVELGQVGGQTLDEGVSPEGDDPGHVAVRLRGEGLAQEAERVLSAAIADRIRQVDHEDRRQAVDRQHQLEPSQGEDERGQEHRPDGESDAPATRTQAPA